MPNQPFGLLNLHKPPGWTSRQAVDRVARLVKPAKAGHAGTLDPLATGVLVVCVGRATRLIGFVQELPKTYRAEFLLGKRSDTDDVTGAVVDAESLRHPSIDEVRWELATFVGRIEQIPPQFSAVHVDGRRAYKEARKGRNVEIAPRMVDVHRIELIRYDFPAIETVIECGSGVYIRSIGRDLGEALGCGAVMSRLERTAIGPFRVENAVDPRELTAESLAARLVPAMAAVSHLPRHVCTSDDCERLRNGRPIPADGFRSTATEDGQVAVVDPDGRLAALAMWEGNGRSLQPKQVFC